MQVILSSKVIDVGGGIMYSECKNQRIVYEQVRDFIIEFSMRSNASCGSAMGFLCAGLSSL